MAFCQHCGKELPPTARYCPECGILNEVTQISIQDEELSAYVGPRAPYYLKQFRKFALKGGGFALSWNWSAFFFGPIWMLYRRLYFWAILAFLVEWIPGFNLLIWIAVGSTANYLYFRHVQSRILELKQYRHTYSDLLLSLRMNGGVSPGAAFVGCLLWLLFFLGIVCTAVVENVLSG